ncbi:mannose-1-phosphate guanyltransferase, partial [Methylorubrum populi]
MAEADRETILPVILCGGSGTRLWPASRESMPKQFTPLVDPTTSTFQATIRRVADPAVFARPTVIASAESRFIVAEQLAQTGIAADILLEPERRDSAAAVAVAALHGARRGPETVVLVMAADHVIEDAAAFARAAREAALGARLGQIMTLGITPTRPATEYGYIRTGGALPDAPGLERVERFVEKPDAAGAERLIGEGALWNSGYFLFRADVMLAELKAHAPEVLEAARAALANAVTDLDFVRLEAVSFARAPKTSIDYAVMERTTRAGVLAVSFAWSDVGTWDAVWGVLERNAQGNALRGRVELIGTRNSLVHSEGEGLTTVVGLEDVVVVTTPDAVLVASKAQSGRVKDLVSVLREKAHPEADAHRRMYRPWGWYQRIDIGERFQVKRIMVTPGGRLSLQKHFHRAEHWVVVKGTAEVTVDERVVLVHE